MNFYKNLNKTPIRYEYARDYSNDHYDRLDHRLDRNDRLDRRYDENPTNNFNYDNKYENQQNLDPEKPNNYYFFDRREQMPVKEVKVKKITVEKVDLNPSGSNQQVHVQKE